MATKKKKTAAKKKRKKTSRKKTVLKRELMKTLIGVGVLLLLVAATGLVANHYLSEKAPVSQKGEKIVRQPVTIPEKKRTWHKDKARIKARQQPLRYEIYPENEIPRQRPAVAPLPPSKDQKPRVAIIIDDLGYDRVMAYKFIELDADLTFSILPFSTFQNEISRKARNKGAEVMLHLPMEPKEFPKIHPGPGALLSSMPPDELIRQLNADLAAIPGIKGVNNHMGSRLTMDSDRMNQIFSVLKRRNLFFIDSRTTSGTLSIQSARLFKVPFAQRDVFLDHVVDAAHIREQIDLLMELAESHGEAVGIGHPHRMTYEVLRDRIPMIQKKADLVPASRIAHPLG